MSKSVPEPSEIAKASDVKLAIRDKEHTTGLFNEDNSRASSHDESEITGSNSYNSVTMGNGQEEHTGCFQFSHALTLSLTLALFRKGG